MIFYSSITVSPISEKLLHTKNFCFLLNLFRKELYICLKHEISNPYWFKAMCEVLSWLQRMFNQSKTFQFVVNLFCESVQHLWCILWCNWSLFDQQQSRECRFQGKQLLQIFLVKLLCLLKHDIRMTNYLLHALLCCLPIVVCFGTPHLSYQFEIFTWQNINSNLSLICG